MMGYLYYQLVQNCVHQAYQMSESRRRYEVDASNSPCHVLAPNSILADFQINIQLLLRNPQVWDDPQLENVFLTASARLPWKGPASQPLPWSYIHFSLGACCGAGSTHPGQFVVPGWEMDGNQRIFTQTGVPPLIHLNTWKTTILSVLVPLSMAYRCFDVASWHWQFWTSRQNQNPQEIITFNSKTSTSNRLCKPHFSAHHIGFRSQFLNPTEILKVSNTIFHHPHLLRIPVAVFGHPTKILSRQSVTSSGLQHWGNSSKHPTLWPRNSHLLWGWWGRPAIPYPTRIN